MSSPRILILGAHPDDADLKAGGTASKWRRLGCEVKLVSVTDGRSGHQTQHGPALAERRRAEARAAGAVIGAAYDLLDHPDGALMPTLEARYTLIRLIRGFRPDLVLTHRPNDYHPDHRYTSVLVQDAAYMITVPFFNPDVPALKKNPVFLYASDRFQRPNPFRADVAVDIDDVIEPTLDALLVMEAQIHGGGANGYEGLYPSDLAGKQR